MLQLLPQRKYSYYRIYSFIAVLLLSVVSAQAQLSFTNQAAAKNLHIGTSAKDGGFTWADFNNDGNKDLLINTNNGTAKSRLLYSNGAPNFTFTDVTASKAPALLSNLTERSAIAGDIDNDGDIDFVRNTHS
ncbi:MAG: FG-GAP-like repeat-containing protein, partial [Ferruginibacter sp.]